MMLKQTELKTTISERLIRVQLRAIQYHLWVDGKKPPLYKEDLQASNIYNTLMALKAATNKL